MQYVVSASLIIAAIIHLLPLSGVLGLRRLELLYGIPLTGQNLEILMRHRAVLLGLMGAFLLWAAFRPSFQVPALLLGLVSVVSFLGLAWSVGGYNAAVGRVVAADIVALVALVIGSIAYVAGRAP
jgi:hypothetical protein